MRSPPMLVVIALAIGACAGSDSSSQATTAGSTAPPATMTTLADVSTTTSFGATTAATTTATTTSSTTTTTRTTPTDLESGLFCCDLSALGYDYESAVAYWTSEGRPERMDADRNGIPCQTVYEPAEVMAYWGDPLPTTTAAPTVTLTRLGSYVANQWQRAGGYSIEWECQLDHGDILAAGSVATCRPTETGEGEYPVLTALILNDTGKVAVAQSGLPRLELAPEIIIDTFGTGKLCRDVLDPDNGLPAFIPDSDLHYFGAVLYWFMEDRPDRMDADTNGIPCETLVDSDTVARFWRGGWLGDIM